MTRFTVSALRKLALATLLIGVVQASAWAFEPFVVKDIRVEGLRRISAGTVFNYLPVHVNDRMDDAEAAQAIRALYKTGFFQDVSLDRDGNVLVVHVVERPAIASVEIEGNNAIKTDKLKSALKNIGLAEGRVFNRFMLNEIEQQLRKEYYNVGMYGVKIQSTVSPLPRNRVGVRIDIKEGEPATVQNITIVGNKRYSEDKLRSLFQLGPKHWYQFFSDRDKYSREKLAGDLENLQSFYQDQGFVNFTITSTQVTISPNRRSIHITVNISEGHQYKVSGAKVAGDLVVPQKQLTPLVAVQKGTLYSHKVVVDDSQKIKDRLGEAGYAFANVNVVPKVDKKNKTVFLTYYVDPGKRVYVRRINVTGNTHTQDVVIRREMRQMEGGWFSNKKIKESKEHLDRTGFFKQVNIKTPQVPGKPDQVDLNIAVQEALSGSIQAGVGYGAGQGVLLNFGVQQNNFLGTGDNVTFQINNSSINRTYNLNYTQRYYTINGVSRQFFATYQDTNANNASVGDYSFRTVNAGMGYGIPLTDNDRVSANIQYENIKLTLNSSATPRLFDFADRYGTQFDNYKSVIGWTRDTRDTAIFPNHGAQQHASLELSLPGSALDYYKVNYRQERYFSLAKKLTLEVRGSLGYGGSYGKTSTLPFFYNYYAGGISTVRGYETNTLGPVDPADGTPTGGNARVLGGLELYFPVPGTNWDSIRMSTFLDGGQVYDTHAGGIQLSQLRYSAGVGFTWMSPLGALTLDFAQPLNAKSGDRRQRVQFSLGGYF